jgi:hypothetical protein
LLLASLYLPWQAQSCTTGEFFHGQPVCALLDLFSGERTTDGLSSEVGRAAALFALLLAALAAAAWARPGLGRGLPLGRCALLAGYFGLAVGVETHTSANPEGFDAHLAYGAYVGLTAIIVILAAAGAARRGELTRYVSAFRLVLLVLVAGLLVAFLLPWWEQSGFGSLTVTSIGLVSPAAVVAAALALCLPGFWSRPDTTPEERLGLAAAVALFTGGAAVSLAYEADHAYGVWPALGIALVLVVLALVVERPGRSRLAQVSWRQLAVSAAGALFLATLFLPWQRWCYEAGSGFGPLAGQCISADGWGTIVGAAAALLALALVVAVLQPRRVPLSVVELAVGFGLLVVTLGFLLDEGGGGGLRVEHGYGSTIGFVLAAALIALALALLRVPKLGRRRALVRSVPIATCVAYLAIIVVPWWGVLPSFQSKYIFILPALSWLTIAGALLGIRLLRLWVLQVADASGRPELVLLPLALLALATVDLINRGGAAITWGSAAVVGLCLLLALLGQIEQRGGFDNLRIPEALRIDRI